ncbi:MAG: redox-sensing transcriptional repressor Rex [Candidatus Cloacimonetes bacterium]|nr:redox-sensing transcriptional repressor Rex [Candidatus Cloacimonadota bacterium]
MKNGVNDSAIRRLPIYYRHILVMHTAGVEFTSARILSELTGVHQTQIRKDIALTGLVGIPKKGHNVNDLIEGIKSFLNWGNIKDTVLVGAGNLGKAILKYDKFKDFGIQIVAAFDVDEEVIGKVINNIKIYSAEELQSICIQKNIKLGIICTPPEISQKVTDELILGGIKGIWNFTQSQLNVPDEIVVETVDLYRGLGVISKRLSEKKIQKYKKK